MVKSTYPRPLPKGKGENQNRFLDGVTKGVSDEQSSPLFRQSS